MSAANEIKAYQRKEYLSKFVNESVRPDNRGLGDTREAVSTSKDMYVVVFNITTMGRSK